jgi:hypothetical protein
LQAALDKCKAANASLQADLEEIIFETAEEQKQVSFKFGDSDSYCPDFELCLMQVLSQTSYNKAWPLVKCVYLGTTGRTITDEPTQAYL